MGCNENLRTGFSDGQVGQYSKNRARRFLSSVCSSKVLVAILLLPFFKSSFYDYLGSLGTISNSMLVVETVVFAGLFLMAGYRSKLAVFLLVYFAWSCFLAPALSGFTGPSLYYLYEGLGFTLFVFLGVKSAGISFLNNLSGVFCAASLLNLLMVFAYPNGFVSTLNGAVWLFGIRTGFPYVLIPAICFCTLYDSVRSRGTVSIRTFITFGVAIVSIVDQWIATGLLELAVYFALFAWVCLRKKIGIRFGALVIAVLGVLVVVAGPSTYIGDWLSLLGKDATFTGRTDIWAAVLADIARYPLFGCGGVEYVIVNGEVKAFHCLWLSVAHESGLIGLALYCTVFIVAIQCLHKRNRVPSAMLNGIALLAILAASIVEIQSYFPFIYGVLAFCELIATEKNLFDGSTIPVIMKVR
jgi:O-antigen ligase